MPTADDLVLYPLNAGSGPEFQHSRTRIFTLKFVTYNTPKSPFCQLKLKLKIGLGLKFVWLQNVGVIIYVITFVYVPAPCPAPTLNRNFTLPTAMFTRVELAINVSPAFSDCAELVFTANHW